MDGGATCSGTLAPGTTTAEHTPVHVELTSFKSDAYTLSIEINPDKAMDSPELRHTPTQKSPELESLQRPHKGSERTGHRLIRPAQPVIGASTLSIIGMIEPGRTVRLYRQIH